jgi:hypothetical protein
MKKIGAAIAICLLVGWAEVQALGQTPINSAEVTAEAVNFLAGQQYYGTVGDFHHIWKFKTNGSTLVLYFYASGTPEFRTAIDPPPGMGHGADIPVLVSKMGSTLHLEFTYHGHVTMNGATRVADSCYHADVNGNTITGAAGPCENDRVWRISLTRKTP